MVPQLSQLPDVFLSDAELATAVHRAVAAGTLRKLGPRLYTKDVGPAAEVVAKHRWRIVALYFPGAVITDRTAFEIQPSNGTVFVAATTTRDVRLPGLLIRAEKGPPALAGDRPFGEGLFLASPARRYLDNMRPARARTTSARRLTRAEIEERLERDLRERGATYLNGLRDQIKTIAVEIDRNSEQRVLDGMIGTLLGTRKTRVSAKTAKARAAGDPYDPQRAALFERLTRDLVSLATPTRYETGDQGLLPFFEAYFSTFIEGTEFDVNEAADIVFHHVIPAGRPADAHDLLGTYAVVSDLGDMGRTPKNVEQLESLLRERHAKIMSGRPEKRPGEWKQRRNQAGNTIFVAPDLVRGTLAQAFELGRSLADPFQRAAYMMFVVSEVHPFDDGNGRIARVMMNAELVPEGMGRIVIPTSYRNNYLVALKRLTNTGDSAAYCRMLDFAQRYTSAVDFSTMKGAIDTLSRTNAFIDARTAEDEGRRLRLP